jgi:hypothetical protein
MNQIALKSIGCIVLMLAFFIMALSSDDASNGKLFAAISLILGAFASYQINTTKRSHYE